VHYLPASLGNQVGLILDFLYEEVGADGVPINASWDCKSTAGVQNFFRLKCAPVAALWSLANRPPVSYDYQLGEETEADV
jgi:hypothetical protein